MTMTEDSRQLFDAIKKIKHTGAMMPPLPQIKPHEMMMLHAVLRFCEHRQREAGEGVTDAGVTISELSQFLELTPSAVSQTVKALEQKGLVQRTASESDRRNVHVRLTSQGESLFQVAEQRMAETFNRLTEALGQEETRQLIALLGKMTALLNDPAIFGKGTLPPCPFADHMPPPPPPF